MANIIKQRPIQTSRLRLPVLLSLLLCPTSAFAHGDEVVAATDLRPVKVSFHLKALSADWFTPQDDAQAHHQDNIQDNSKAKSISFNKAYLASFSLNLVPCLMQKKSTVTNIDTGFFEALIPKAYANHGVRFDMPTQIPLMLGLDLSQDSSHFVGEFMLPIGRYCEINYTMAHITSAKQLASMTPYSLYLKGENKKPIATAAITDKPHHSNNKQAIELSARYAYGQNIPVNFEVTAASQRTLGANLTLTLAPEAAFTSALAPNKLAQAEHLIVRELLLTIPKQLRATYTETTNAD